MICFVDNMEIPGRYPDEVQGPYSISYCNEMVRLCTYALNMAVLGYSLTPRDPLHHHMTKDDKRVERPKDVLAGCILGMLGNRS